MPNYGRSSKAELKTCHPDIQEIMWQVIEDYDCKIIWGHRSPSFQFSLFKKGRVLKNGIWVVADKSKVVTYRDGFKKLSRHNATVSEAIDVAPWPIDWKNINEFNYMAGIIMETAKQLLFARRIKNKLQYGGRLWKNFKDWPHFQLKRPLK